MPITCEELCGGFERAVWPRDELHTLGGQWIRIPEQEVPTHFHSGLVASLPRSKTDQTGDTDERFIPPRRRGGCAPSSRWGRGGTSHGCLHDGIDVRSREACADGVVAAHQNG